MAISAFVFTWSLVGRDGKKRVLACLCKSGRENLENWKLVLRGLIERGLRRLLIVVHDVFSGLLPITKTLFPGADVQLCAVHMQRNAKNYLSKSDNTEFQQRWRAVRSTWGTGRCNSIRRALSALPAQLSHLRRRITKKTRPLSCLSQISRSFATFLVTTNAVEAVNGQLEIIRRNSGGYFQSDDTVKLKLGIIVTALENRRWCNIPGRVELCLHQLNAQFQRRFESES
jgi:transposase-like protein